MMVRETEGWLCPKTQKVLNGLPQEDKIQRPPSVSGNIGASRDTEDCLVRCTAKETNTKGNY